MENTMIIPPPFTQKVMLGITVYKYITSIAFGHMMATMLDGINTGFIKQLHIEADMYVSLARNMMARKALEEYHAGNITHVLLLDDDILIMPGTVLKLATSGHPVISGVYYTQDLRPVAYDWSPEFKFRSELPDKGEVVVGGTGCGCLMVACEVFQKMKEHFGDDHFFQSATVLENGEIRYLGEDVFFFQRLMEMRIPTVIDCSVQCGHARTAVIDRDVIRARDKLNAMQP